MSRCCPICEGEERELLGAYEQGWELYECLAGGHWYLDKAGMSQAKLDEYYAGDTSPDLHTAADDERLARIADVLNERQPKRAVDIGGKWSQLQSMAKVETVNAGERLEGMYDCAVLSHTLEHVYDVPGLMREITAHLAPGGLLLVEGPVWPRLGTWWYDYHWQHVNKFRRIDYLDLLSRWGFGVVFGQDLAPYGEYHCYRVEGTFAGRGR